MQHATFDRHAGQLRHNRQRQLDRVNVLANGRQSSDVNELDEQREEVVLIDVG